MTISNKAIAPTAEQLAKICTSEHWQHLMLHSAPYCDFSAFCDHAEKAFCQLNEQDWLEAFAGHPMIGDLSTLAGKYSQGQSLSEAEQSGVNGASEEVLKQLIELNHAYKDKFGFIFIVCATEKSASEMLAILTSRISNNISTELLNASIEQRKISRIRMEAYR